MTERISGSKDSQEPAKGSGRSQAWAHANEVMRPGDLLGAMWEAPSLSLRRLRQPGGTLSLGSGSSDSG
jgi:hypothetical protein